MLPLALSVGIYGLLIFFLGIFNVLFKDILIGVSVLYFLAVILYFFKFYKIRTLNTKLTKLSLLFLVLIGFQSLINLIGALAPELGFDALWYHLTIPKIFIINHSVFHIPGNLLYYSDLPKIVEMIYIPLLFLKGEIFAKLFHFSLGILSTIALYKLSRLFLKQEFALLSSLIFYSSLVVAWQSITAYVDLGRTFFEIVALYELLKWNEKKELKYLIYSGLILGFSISSKISALNSLPVYLILIFIIGRSINKKFVEIIKFSALFIGTSLLVVLPWMIFSFINTGNPVYPLFENFFKPDVSISLLNLVNLFLFSSDPINPLYFILIPLIFLNLSKFSFKEKLLIIYVILSLFFWLITSSFGGSRFILPYLPAFSLLSAITIFLIKDLRFRKYMILITILISLSSIGYRAIANLKYINFIEGSETKHDFLSKNLNFKYGDFYDTDNFFAKNIKTNDKVLLFGFHNLYYVEFPFIDSSWVKKGDKFNYIAIQNSKIPERFSDWKKIYSNKKTGVELYSKEDKFWAF